LPKLVVEEVTPVTIRSETAPDAERTPRDQGNNDGDRLPERDPLTKSRGGKIEIEIAKYIQLIEELFGICLDVGEERPSSSLQADAAGSLPAFTRGQNFKDSCGAFQIIVGVVGHSFPRALPSEILEKLLLSGQAT